MKIRKELLSLILPLSMLDFKSEKALFKYVTSHKQDESISIKKILEKNKLSTINIGELLAKLKIISTNILLIDSRSEKEYDESHIPCSINFPILNNLERHYTGLIYKKYSSSAAVKLAIDFAEPKREILKEFLIKNNAANKNIYTYCWRGGGRSGYLSKMIFDAGYESEILSGGFKSYRRVVNNFFSAVEFPYRLLEIFGNTGCGKSEILKKASEEIPVIDLEYAARHFSSLLGHIPYQLKGYPKILNQSVFENNLFSQIYFNKNINNENKNICFLIEGESRRVGDFNIPLALFKKLQTAPCIQIVCSLENRIKRIVNDYFGSDLSGIEPMIKIMKEKEKYFKQQLSNRIHDKLIYLLENKRVEEFTEIMIKNYYDKKYKDKGKKPLSVISSDNLNNAVKEIIHIYSNL